MAAWIEFRKCAGYGLDFGTGQGPTSLCVGRLSVPPGGLNVFCDQCRFDSYTMEGNPSCVDPAACEHAEAPLAHMENY